MTKVAEPAVPLSVPQPASEERPALSGPLEAIIVLGGVQIVTMVAGLARSKVLAVVLGPAGLGITGAIDQIVAFLAHLGSMSIPFAALRYLSRYRNETGNRLAPLYFAFRRALLFTSVVALLGGLVFVEWKISNSANDLARYRIPLLLGVLSLPAVAFVGLDRNVLAVFDRSRMSGVVAMVGAIAVVGSSYFGLRLNGLNGLYAGNLVVSAATAVFLALYVQRRLIPGDAAYGGWRSTFPKLRAEPGLVKFCTLIHLLTLASPAAYLISRLVLLDKRGAVEAGLMTAAFGFGVAVRTAMSQANALYLTPLANRPTPMAERAAAVSHYGRTLTVLFLLAVLPIVLFPDAFLALLYSRSFVAARGSIGAFLIAEGFLLMAGVYQSLLVGFDDINGYTALTVIANVVTIAASLLLIPPFGILGSAVAFICGNALLLVMTLVRLARSHATTQLARHTAVFWLGITLLAVVSWWVSTPSSSPLVFRIVAGVAGYAMLLPLVSFSEIRQMLTRRKS